MSGSAGLNFTVVSAVVPSTVAVIRAVPVIALTRLVRATLLPSASTAAGISSPSVVENVTVRRCAGSPGATVAEITSGVTPSAGADERSVVTVMICAGSTGAN